MATATKTTERPIIMTCESVRAIREGKKTQTRRVVKPQPTWRDGKGLVAAGWRWLINKRQELQAWPENAIGDEMCKYSQYQVGQRLWVKEAYGFGWHNGLDGYSALQPTGEQHEKPDKVFYRADHPEWGNNYCWRYPLFMPRWASRLTLEVTEVRVQRLHSISAKDILAEGVVARSHDCEAFAMIGANPKCPVGHDDICYPDLRSLWAATWNKINGRKHPWKSNPWLWVITFTSKPAERN